MKLNDDQQSSIKKFTEAAVYKFGLHQRGFLYILLYFFFLYLMENR